MLRFHIVNSVKGGCGKSTFSLYLANYLRRNKSNPIIIDLDICGTTWYTNNQNFIINKKKCHFLNDMFYGAEKNLGSEHIFRLHISDPNDKNKPDDFLNIIMADPTGLSTMDDDTLDLLESTVYKIVMELCQLRYNSTQSNNVFNIHENVTDIIFDMPPGYEKHTERILCHLMMDLESKLYQEFKKRNNFNYVKVNGMQVYKKIEEKSNVYLYMISGLNQASFEANLVYVQNLFINAKFSTDTGILNKDNTYFILNNIPAIEDINLETLLENIRSKLKDPYNLFQKSNIQYIKHCDFEYEKEKLQAIYTSVSSPNVLLFGKEIEEFNRVLKDVIKNE